MSSPSPRLPDAAPILFVAREPDETLRTFLPVIDALRERHGVASRVLFHHPPGAWARAELARRAAPLDVVDLPAGPLASRRPFRRVAHASPIRTVDEIGRFRRARALARAILERHRPAAVVVIQDTLLLERFLVREANRRGLPTLVVQWAFSFPQALYDRIRTIQHGPEAGRRRPGPLGRIAGPLTRRAYRGALRALDVSFDLANTYGGGEARLFAVMGEAFREQYVAQGVRVGGAGGKRVVVTGHPTHDATYRLARSVTDADRRATRAGLGLPADGPLVLYATQPVLWRKVVTPEQLRANVAAVAAAVARAPGAPRLALKLHPRERAEDYAFCAELDPPPAVIPRAEVAELIAACDAFISSSSSTVLLAMMLDRPIVTVNFDAVPHFDYFEAVGGTLHARAYDEFERALRLALSDEAARARLADERARVLERYARFDGRATERIAGLLIEALGGAAAPAAAEPVGAGAR